MTGLSGVAYLEIDIVDSNGDERTCVFELREDLEIAPTTTKQYLLGNRGQYVREAFEIGTDFLDIEGISTAGNRRGYHVDGGAGAVMLSVNAKAGDRDVRWGDGSSDPDDATSITKFDAQGCGPSAQRDVLDWAVSQSKSDSAAPARLYYGQWSDGTHADTAGAYGKPRIIAITELLTPNPSDDPSAFEVDLEGVWTSAFPASSVGEAQEAINELLEASTE